MSTMWSHYKSCTFYNCYQLHPSTLPLGTNVIVPVIVMQLYYPVNGPYCIYIYIAMNIKHIRACGYCNVAYFGPALMTGHDSVLQWSVMVPYNMLIWLKKSTAFEGGGGVRVETGGKGERLYFGTRYCLVDTHTCTSHLRQLIFLRKSDCLGCVLLLCLVCLTLLASFFLPFFSISLTCTPS